MRTEATSRLTAGVLLLSLFPVFAQSDLAFDLDVPEGHTEPWLLDSLNGANRLEAELEIREFRRDVRWRPAFNVMVRAGEREIVLNMVQQGDNRFVIPSVLLMQERKLLGRQSLDGWRIVAGQRFEMSMDWSTPGVLAIGGAGKERGRFKLDFVPTSVRFSASTGRFVGHKVFLTTR
jgi:hypothetical protein